MATTTPTVPWAVEAARRGAGEILLTSIRQDGQRTGLRPGAHRRRARRGVDSGDRLGRRGIGRDTSPTRCASPTPRSSRRSCTRTRRDCPACAARSRASACNCDREGDDMSDELRAAIVQDDATGRVLMLGWMDDEALAPDAVDAVSCTSSRVRASSCGGRARPRATRCTSSRSRPTATTTRCWCGSRPDGPTCHDGVDVVLHAVAVAQDPSARGRGRRRLLRRRVALGRDRAGSRARSARRPSSSWSPR